MADSREHTLTGTRGTITAREWPRERPRYVALLVHGYGEHIGRYEYVADVLHAMARPCSAPTTWGTGSRRASVCWSRTSRTW
jgi:hypothetical protein